jgi:hypothetical protein
MKLRDLTTDNQYEVVKVKAILIPFPVRFDFPIEIRDSIPLSLIKMIEGVRVLRFYTPPSHSDVIEFRGCLWKCVGRFHEDLKVKGSQSKDKMPIVLTEFLGMVNS